MCSPDPKFEMPTHKPFLNPLTPDKMKTFPPKMKMKSPARSIWYQSVSRGSFPALLALLWMSGAPLNAATTTWDAGEAPVTNWSTGTFANWSDNASPAGKDVVFGSTGSTASSTTVTNTVNGSLSINSLTYQYNSATNYQVTDILSGSTLSVGGTSNVFTVGGMFQALPATNTNSVIKGAGTLDINQSGGQVFIGNNTSASATPSKVLLDMSDLTSFNANLGSTGSFNVGTTTTNASPTGQGSSSTVYLADTNQVTVGTLRVSAALVTSVNLGAEASTLYLGRVNTLYADSILVGRGQDSSAYGILKFDPSATSAALTIRGANGTSAAGALRIGVNEGPVTGTSQRGTVDFSGGNVDAQITDVLIGSGRSNSAGTAQGELSMNLGTIIATNTIVGQTVSTSASTSSATTSGALNVNGGQYQTQTLVLADSASTLVGNTQPLSGVVNVSGAAAVSVAGAGGVVMGRHGGASNAAPLTATINLTGGSLTVSGNIAEGLGAATIASTLNLNGGTLEMNSKTITVDTFTAASGTLRNLSQLNGGGTLTKTTAGTLTVAGTNTYTGTTVISLGTLLVTGTHTGGGAYSINSGGTLGGNGTITTASNAGVTLAAGGKLSPGTSAGNLQFDLGSGVLNLSAGVTSSNSQALLFELGSSSDKITLTNAGSSLNIGSGLLEFDDFVFTNIAGFGPGTYTLFDTGNTIVGTLGSTLTGSVGGYSATIQFANSNQDLVLNVVPEPSTALLVLAGALLCIARRQRMTAA